MLALLNSLNAHNLPIFQPILMILVSKFMIHRALSDTTYLSLGLLSPLMFAYEPGVYEYIHVYRRSVYLVESTPAKMSPINLPFIDFLQNLNDLAILVTSRNWHSNQ